MINLLITLLIVAFAAIVTYLVWLLVRPDPEPADVDRPLVAPMSDVDADTELFYLSRHHEDTVEIVNPMTYDPPVYSRAFASVMGYDRPSARPGREAGR